jgi:hypothetical protein
MPGAILGNCSRPVEPCVTAQRRGGDELTLLEYLCFAA